MRRGELASSAWVVPTYARSLGPVALRHDVFCCQAGLLLRHTYLFQVLLFLLVLETLSRQSLLGSSRLRSDSRPPRVLEGGGAKKIDHRPARPRAAGRHCVWVGGGERVWGGVIGF